MALLIGSRALSHWLPKYRKPGDWDIIISKEEAANWSEPREVLFTSNGREIVLVDGVKFELEFDICDSCQQLLELAKEIPFHTEINGLTLQIATLPILLAVKKSHIHQTTNWHKHIQDYHLLKKYAVLTPELEQLSETRKKERERRGPKRSMNVDNNSFFADSQKFVHRVYIHDDLHYATCYYDRPIWIGCKKDPDKAAISQELFERLSHGDKIKMVQEEAFALALERRVIPGVETDPTKAFRYALMRICTNLTRGWFRTFATENYPEVIKFDHDYIGKFQEALAAGKVREVKEEQHV